MPTITFKKEVEETLEVEFPMYINTGYSIAAIFDSEHFVQVTYIEIVNYGIQEMRNNIIVSSWMSGNQVKPSNRLEFLKAYNYVASKLSQLIPD